MRLARKSKKENYQEQCQNFQVTNKEELQGPKGLTVQYSSSCSPLQYHPGFSYLPS